MPKNNLLYIYKKKIKKKNIFFFTGIEMITVGNYTKPELQLKSEFKPM